MTKGCFMIPRGLLDLPTFGNAAREPYDRRSAFVWLIENANYADGKVGFGKRTITVKRGQLSFSLRFMAKAWGWDDAKVRRFISRIVEDGLIDCVSDAGQLLITICNYDDYQTIGRVGDAASDAEATQTRRGGDANQNEGTTEHTEGSSEPSVSPSPRAAEQTREALEIWNAVCGDVLAKVRATDGRKRTLPARLKREFGGDMGRFREFCQRIRGSPWLTGENPSGWKADFDWAMAPKNITPITEGRYDRRTGGTHVPGARPTPGQDHRPVTDDDSRRRGIVRGMARELDAQRSGPH